jgi:prepilin-type N-terminal cleavage/methylation domain-containing protein
MNKDCSGFTLIETIVVLILVGVLAVNIVIHWPADDELKLPAQADLMASHIRHLQSLAMYWGQPLRLSVSSGSYSVSCVTTSASSPCNNSPVIDPVTGQAFSTTLESGITLSGSATTDFDSLGRPVSSGSLISAARTFTLSAGTSATVTLNPLTGFVSVSP